MRLLSLKLLAADVTALAGFYVDQLGLLPVERTPGRLTLQIGHSRLVFQHNHQEPAAAPTYHFAFNIPAGSIAAAAAWLGERAELLAVGGRPIVEFPNWAARSIYARDPGGNVIECIARQELALPPVAGRFSAADLHGVSEIGLVAADVPAFAAELRRVYGLPVFQRQPPDPHFTVLGDDEGLFIIVPPGRVWYPTPDDRSGAFPLKVGFEARPNGVEQELYWP